MGPRRMAVDDPCRLRMRRVRRTLLQWGHGAWPWMTEGADKQLGRWSGLQWGHGAWPWMTGPAGR